MSGVSRSDDEDVQARVARLGGALGAAGQRVANLIRHRPAAVLAGSALELAASARTSDATVVRTVQALGYAGLAELRHALAASLDRPARAADDMRQTLAGLDDAASVLDTVLDAHAEAVVVLRSPVFRAQLLRALPLLHAAERVVTFGIGPSANLARYAGLLLGRIGRRSLCLDGAGSMLADQMLQLRERDAILALAYGPPYREVASLFREAGRLAVPVVLISDTAGGKLSKTVDVVLAIPRGMRHRVALHGGTLVGLEAVVLAMAAMDRDATLASFDRLSRLRAELSTERGT